MAVVPKATTMKLNLDYRAVIGALLLVIVGMLFMWRPWETPFANDRIIEVTGQTTLKAVPDEFVFYPMYQFKSADKQSALDKLSKKSDAIVSKLKALGVADKDIKTSSSGYDYPVYYSRDGKTATYSLSLTVTVGSKELAQKVQDYLVTTSPTGSVSPQAGFSEAKRTELENQARGDATKDARSKAEQSARNLGFSLGAIKSVTDSLGFNGSPYPLYSRDAVTQGAAEQGLALQPGENELSYSVAVVYYVR